MGKDDTYKLSENPALKYDAWEILDCPRVGPGPCGPGSRPGPDLFWPIIFPSTMVFVIYKNILILDFQKYVVSENRFTYNIVLSTV